MTEAEGLIAGLRKLAADENDILDVDEFDLLVNAATALQQAIADKHALAAERNEGYTKTGNLERALTECIARAQTAEAERDEALEGKRVFAERAERFEGYASQVQRLTASLEDEREDAERWRALMSSPKMHWMGSAGFDHHLREGAMSDSRALVDQDPVPRAGTSWHFGMEFWFGIEADSRFPDTFERRLMVAYVDAIRAHDTASR